jgi:serine/threonine-protein kinase HipA
MIRRFSTDWRADVLEGLRRIVADVLIGNVTFKRFRRVADFLKLDPDWIEREMKAVVETALDLWPGASLDLLDEARARQLLNRLDTLALVQEARR